MTDGPWSRRAIKAWLEAGAVRRGPAALLRWMARRSPLILAYHNVVPDDAPPAGDRSLHLPRAQFAAHLDVLAASCDVRSLDALLGTPPAVAGRPQVAITFDDAYRGAVTLAVAELATRSLPATIFVVPGSLGETFWWDTLADAATGGPRVPRAEALGALRGEGSAILRWAEERGIAPAAAPPHARAADERELQDALRHPGITFGSHTWSHPNLARLGRAELLSELRESWTWLAGRFPGRVTPWVAYPYGETSALVGEVAAELGYRGGLRIGGGRLKPARRSASFFLPRYNVPAGLSLRGFRLRVGALPE